MKTNNIKEVSPLKGEVVYIFNKNKTEVHESWIISFHGEKPYWSNRGPVSYGGPIGYPLSMFPYWVSRQTLLESVNNVTE